MSEPSDTEAPGEKSLIHPAETFSIKAKFSTPPASSFTSSKYGELDDNSSASHYAWEFLRRNRFYQALQTGRSIHFNLADWGWRPSPSHEPGYGLEELKPFEQSHDESNPPVWTPIHHLEQRLNEQVLRNLGSPAGARQLAPTLEYPETQIAVVFDLFEAFGPETVGIRLQAERAVAHLQMLVEKRRQNAAGTASKTPESLRRRSSPKLMRNYLRLADVLSTAQRYQSPEKSGLPKAKHSEHRFLSMSEVAHDLPDHFFAADGKMQTKPGDKVERCYAYAEQAQEFIYRWRCLTLLTKPDLPKPKNPLSPNDVWE